MTIIYVLLALTILIQLGICLAVYQIKIKQGRGLFIRRAKDAIYLEDEKGTIIEEKIKINIK